MATLSNYVPGDSSMVFGLVNAARLHDGHRPMPREDLQGRLTDPHFSPERCWLAREGGQLLGYAVSLFFPYDAGDEWAFLFGVVHPAHGKSGIGTRLMELVLAQ